MKFALLVLLVLIGVLLWRNRQPTDRPTEKKTDKTSREPLNMVRCTLCSVHVPVADIVEGKNGPYCCADHRQQAEP
jgi:uncharacterized protein